MIPAAASLDASPKTTFERVFDRIAGLYDNIYGPFLQQHSEVGVRMLGIESGMRVLEVGIGTGASLSLYPRDIDIVGIDPSANMLDKARRRVEDLNMEHVELVEVGAEGLQCPDGGFDRVLLSSVLSVVPDPADTLGQVARLTKPGGLACVIAHFAGRTRLQRGFDYALEPVTRILGYRMTTPRSIVEQSADWEIVDQHEFGSRNFSTAYLLRRVES